MKKKLLKKSDASICFLIQSLTMEGYEGDGLLRNKQVALSRSRAFYDALICSTANRR